MTFGEIARSATTGATDKKSAAPVYEAHAPHDTGRHGAETYGLHLRRSAASLAQRPRERAQTHRFARFRVRRSIRAPTGVTGPRRIVQGPDPLLRPTSRRGSLQAEPQFGR